MSTNLSEWHVRLDQHFQALRSERDQFGQDRPLFALEHGLDLDKDLPHLGDAVRESVAGGRLPGHSWLPFVVYAAEVGYRYQGDEYWPVFEADTPHWKQRGHAAQVYIRKTYERFAETYGGALPSGPWAAWFRNIAWPITHAVLPTDLQRHLARLLYDYRRALTYALIDDHDALGDRLARRSHDTSARFRKFAENSQLLGLVAASLLLGDEEESTLLLGSTLHRIIVDLGRERQAGAWLRDAKKAAVRARLRGFVSPSRVPPVIPIAPESDETRWPKLELELSIRRNRGSWCAYVAVPSHESLAQRFPDVRDDLERVRCRIRGVEQMQSRGALMYRLGPLAMTEWPPSHESVLSPEGGSATLSEILVDQCRLPGSPWLFRLREPGLGSEVRTNLVRPGERYILLRSAYPPSSADLWEPAPLNTRGVVALRLNVPNEVDAAIIAKLQQLGVGIVSDVDTWPAGLVPSSWDGEGRATWPAGEDPIIGVHSSRSATTCVVSTALEKAELPWPEDSDLLFVQLLGLNAGSHRIDVALLDRCAEEPIAEGELQVRLLEPADSLSSVGARQGLQVFSHPSRPTLEELWTGSAAIIADGPHDERVHFAVDLMTRGGRKTLASTSFSSALPVNQARWQELFRSARGSGELSAACDDAEELVVTASNSVLGSTQIRAGRPFAPLRWCAGRDRDGPFARLIDYMDSGDDLIIEYYDAPHPGQPVQPTIDGEKNVRTSNGGLIVARTSEFNASLILPPHLYGGLESLGRLKVRPSLQADNRSAVSVKRMIQLSHLWTRAAIPADSYAEQLQARVNDAVVARLGGMIGGGRWRDIEYDRLEGRTTHEQRLLDLISRWPVDRQSAVALLKGSRTVGPEPKDRAAAFGTVLSLHTSEWDESLADPVLRLATVPGSLPVDDSLIHDVVDEVLKRPALFRLARLFVFALAARENQWDSWQTLRSWPWN